MHGVGGVVGTLLTGVFATAAVSAGSGEGYSGLLEGHPGQVLIQACGVVATAAWSGLGTFLLFRVIEFVMPVRVSKESEIDGLDLSEHGEALQ